MRGVRREQARLLIRYECLYDTLQYTGAWPGSRTCHDCCTERGREANSVISKLNFMTSFKLSKTFSEALTSPARSKKLCRTLITPLSIFKMLTMSQFNSDWRNLLCTFTTKHNNVNWRWQLLRLFYWVSVHRAYLAIRPCSKGQSYSRLVYHNVNILFIWDRTSKIICEMFQKTLKPIEKAIQT